MAFAGVLAALLRGHGYVPLNRTFPQQRTAQMLERSGCRAVVVDEGSADQLDEVLERISSPLLLLLASQAQVSAVAARWPRHEVVGPEDLESADGFCPVAAE